MRKKSCAAFFVFFIAALMPLRSESLRDQNKTYFDSIQWEDLNDLAIPPVPEPYAVEGNTPIPYADTIDDGDILPSLPQLGVLDYRNIPEDLLTFCDTIAAALVAKSVDAAFFTAQKSFLPHFWQFMLERFPDCSNAFYARPSFQQDGSATVLMRLTVTQTAAIVRNENHDTKATVQKENVPLPSTPAETDEMAEETTAEQVENISGVPCFFSDDEHPLFIMLECGALKENNVWKISYLDFKGAEYADSALTN